MFLAFESERTLDLYAYDLEPKPRLIRPRLAFDDADQLQVTALLLDESLVELGVEAGPVSRAAAPARPLLDLVEERYVAHMKEGSLSTWTQGTAPSAALSEFPIPPAEDAVTCPKLEPTILMDHPRGCCTIAIGLADKTALVGQSGHIDHLDTSGAVLGSVDIPDARAGVRGRSGIFVIGQDNLYRLSVAPMSFEVVGGGPTADSFRWPAAGEDDQIFILGELGDFSFFDGATWQKIATLDIGSGSIGTGGSLWLGDRHGAALLPTQPAIPRWDGTALHEDNLPVANELGFGAALTTERYGSVALGSRFGEVLRFTGAAWERLPFDVPPRTQAATEYRDGLAYGTEGGLAGYAQEGLNLRDCPPFPVAELSEVYAMLPLGEALLAAGVDRNDRFQWILLQEVTP